MEVIIFTEAGPEYGYGHLIRCLALAQGIKEKKQTVSFVIRGKGDFSEILSEFPFTVMEWLDFKNLNTWLNSKNIAIIDSYHTEQIHCKNLYKGFKSVLFFDDYMRIDYPGGYVLNSVIGAEELPYPENPKITYLLGTDYQALRKEFRNVPEYIINKNIKNIMITFGGSDPTNETPGYIRKLREFYPEKQLKVVIGKGFQNLENIRKAADDKVELIYYPDALKMRNIMLNSDLAISAAGQTISELARIGVPTFGVQVAENQRNNYLNWLKSGVLISDIYWGKEISEDIRKYCSLSGKSKINGQGVNRITEALLCL